MDATSILFVAVIVLLGGPLAYGADWLGRRLGKKRLSVFGLRPRHTAALLTVGAGVLIPLITVLTMLGLSSGVREWVLRGGQAIEDAKRLTVDRDRLVGEISRNNDQLQDIKRKRAESDRDLRLVRKDLAGIQKLFDQKKRLADDLQKQLGSLNVRLASQERLLRSREGEVKRLAGEVKSRTAEIAKVNDLLAKRQIALATAERSIREIDTSYRRLREDYNALDQERSKLDQQRESLQHQVDDLTPQVSDLRSQVRDLRQQRDDATQDLAKARQDLSDLQALSSQLIGKSLTEPMIYRRGDEIARLAITAGADSDNARRAVENMLSLARAEALKTGAEASDDVNVVGFAPVGGQNPMSPLEVQAALIRGVSNRRDPVVLVATTPFNVFKTQPVRLQVRVMPNPLVYHMGESIADTRIDGRLDTDAIYQLLRIFLSERVTQKAVSDQMIPRIGQDSPLGEVTSRQLFDVVQAIRAEQRIVKVSVIAKVDTHAADPLQIEFRVGR